MNFRTFCFISILISVLTFPSCSPARKIEQDKEISAFKYREVYLPEALGKGADSLGLNSLDEDWGIWGHNLSNVLPEDPSESVYAKVNGVTHRSQFCFSSTKLHEYISEYIRDNYGRNDKARFSIIPNDNDIVCLCQVCVEIGNTKGNASPALFSLINKLSEEFPNHIFYTSDYRTTSQVPNDTLPQNAGVLISAINYPLSYAETPQEIAFMERLDEWNTKTKRILIWDYINNFDDYFTPFPVFGIMQRRLQNYKDKNVTAVFLNGSGPDASSLSDLKSFVLAELTANPDADWKNLLEKKARENYPVTGKAISDFMIAQENFVKENLSLLPLYEGVNIARKTYLPEALFLTFHDNIKTLQDKAQGEEREKIDILLGELALTRLELNRLNGDFSKSEIWIKDIESLLDKNISSYNESGWLIESYLADYRLMLQKAEEYKDNNKLMGKNLKALTPLDDEYSDLSVLTDGLLGLPSNYHNGHVLISPSSQTKIEIPGIENGRKLMVWLSYNPGYKIYLPQMVSLSAPNMNSIDVEPQYPKDLSGHSLVEFELPEEISGPFTLILTKDPEKRSMAIEEIIII
ncbi:MAG: DUF4838 domain-containing protein [Muribaculaceae bacterium]|nr:DUF4838 domain-containing protein [Muribaculaceae bacterium]